MHAIYGAVRSKNVICSFLSGYPIIEILHVIMAIGCQTLTSFSRITSTVFFFFLDHSYTYWKFAYFLEVNIYLSFEKNIPGVNLFWKKKLSGYVLKHISLWEFFFLSQIICTHTGDLYSTCILILKYLREKNNQLFNIAFFFIYKQCILQYHCFAAVVAQRIRALRRNGCSNLSRDRRKSLRQVLALGVSLTCPRI